MVGAGLMGARLIASSLCLTLVSGWAFAQDQGKLPDFGAIAADNAPTAPAAPALDMAFGAFQRGYFATALQEAMNRVRANPHDGAAMALIAEIYAQGLAVKRDPIEAAKWNRLASEAGNREATFSLGMALLKGDGVAKDRAAAKAQFEKAAADNHPGALYNLGVMAVEARDFPTAAGYFRRAADAGDVDSLEALSALYRQGRGVPQDLPKALELLKAAAYNRDASAQVQYGIALFNGEGVTKDEAAAAKYFLKAAAVGNPIAENRLARLYASGRGIGKNTVEAARWHILARAAGVNDTWLDGILAALTPAERTRVEDDLKRQVGY